MKTTLKDALAWAEAEFFEAELGDVRRNKRLVKMAAKLAKSPGGTLPGPLSNWAELKAGYRLLSNEEVTCEKIIAPHLERSRTACREPGEYLMIEDTTELDFTTHLEMNGLGRIGNDGGLGMYLHNSLAVRIERWNAEQEPEVSIVGIFGRKCWVRSEENLNRGYTKLERMSRPRESERWAAVFKEVKRPPSCARWTVVADREADIYEAFDRCEAKGVDYIIRAKSPRALDDRDHSLFDAAARAPVAGRFSLFLRARPGQRARKARLQVRAATVTVRGPWRPGGRLPSKKINVVEVREVKAPKGVTPVHWVLLTTWPVENFEQILRVVKAYAKRWLVEEYHKVLKTGVKVESSQLSTAERIQALLGILSVVSVRLLNAKLLARTQPERPVSSEEFGAEAMMILDRKFGKPDGGWTCGPLIVAVARLGGFLARKGDGNPGWLTIWRGWQKLMLMAQGVAIAGER